MPLFPRVGRTGFLRAATQVPHERRLRIHALCRRNPTVRGLLAPLRWWLRRGSIRVTAGVGEGLRMSPEHLPVAHAHAGFLVRGTLEIPVQEALRRLLGEGDVFYDVGANVGFFTLIAARLVGPRGQVYAFEPVGESAAAVRANAALNGFSNVTVIESAVGASAGRDRLVVVEDLSWSRLERLRGQPGATATVEVEVVAVDQLVEGGELRPPTLVKIDVEGAELSVIEGMRRTLERHRPAVVCELHDTGAAVAAAFASLGYEVSNLDGKEAITEAKGNIHALAIPR
jgi:FkbM family methyltransferase